MTGRYGIRTRIKPEGGFRDIWYGLTSWEITLAELLSTAGYATGMFGKWHLGDAAGRYPTDQGFDEWYGIPNSSDPKYLLYPPAPAWVYQTKPALGATYDVPYPGSSVNELSPSLSA